MVGMAIFGTTLWIGSFSIIARRASCRWVSLVFMRSRFFLSIILGLNFKFQFIEQLRQAL